MYLSPNPASPVSSTIVFPDPNVVSDGGYDALDDLLANELAGGAVNPKRVDLVHYRH